MSSRHLHNMSSRRLQDVFKTNKCLLDNDYVKLPCNEDEWINELKGFIENYELPSSSELKNFRIIISTIIHKNFYNFKHIYFMSNMDLPSGHSDIVTMSE